MGEMLDRYFEWNEVLVEEYFPEGNEGHVAILPVDDDEIVALAESSGICHPEDAIDDFVTVVRATIRGNHGQFALLSRWAKQWREQGRRTPPYVAGLAFCVLAASRMEGDEAVSANNYYDRLNKLLGGTGNEKQPENFDLVHLVWEDLSIWLDHDCKKDRGASTIRTGSHRHIGYPIHQCPLRAIDKRRLPDFFATRGFVADDAETISDGYLFIRLKAWAALQSCPLSKPATAAITKAEGRDQDEIVETVRRELSGWDGSLRDSGGRKRYPLRLQLIPQAERSRLVLIAELPDSQPDGPWVRSDNGQEVMVEHDPASPGWSETLDVPVEANILGNGLKLVREGVALEFEPTPAIPFREDDGGTLVGSFVSQRQTSLWKPHWGVVRRDLLQVLEGYVRTQTGRQLPSHEHVAQFPNNWALAGPLEFINQPELAPVEIANFYPRLTQSVSLRGGLRISQTDFIYLKGGEPDLLVSVDEAAPASQVRIDGQPHGLPFGSQLIPLREMHLGAGEHKIEAGVRRTFSTCITFGDPIPQAAGKLGLSLRHYGGYRPDGPIAQPTGAKQAPEQLVVSGADIRGEPEHLPSRGIPPVFFRTNFKKCMLIGQGAGEIAATESNEAPKWIEGVGLGNQFQFAEIQPDFEPAWRLFENDKGHRGVQYLGRGTIDPPVVTERCGPWFDALYGWAEAEATDPDRQDDWIRFVEKALDVGPEASK